MENEHINERYEADFWHINWQKGELTRKALLTKVNRTFMSNQEMRRCALRVIVYENRIAVEFFHSLTDGTGALIFLKTLTAEYLEQKYKITIPAECGILGGMLIYLAINHSAREMMKRKLFF